MVLHPPISPGPRSKPYLLASDFDHTLSFNDSGVALSEMLGQSSFAEKVNGLAASHLVQQGGELTYLLLHDPEYRCVRREHLVAVGKRIRLKKNLATLLEALESKIAGHQFLFYVISAAPEEVIQSALDGIVPPERIRGTRFNYNDSTGEIESVSQLTAGYGKVAVLTELQQSIGLGPKRTVYVGDGSSDIHVMLHTNHCGGYTIAVSENPHIAPIAKRTVLSDNALSILIPLLEDVVGWTDPTAIRSLFSSCGLEVQGWDRTQMDRLTISETVPSGDTGPEQIYSGRASLAS